MKLNTDEKSLLKTNKNNIFYKIKNFLRNIFGSKKQVSNNIAEKNKALLNEKKEEFNKSLKTNADMTLIDLQLQLKRGKIKIDDLTNEEIEKLIKFYKEQIDIKKNKKKIIEMKLKELGIEYKKIKDE